MGPTDRRCASDIAALCRGLVHNLLVHMPPAPSLLQIESSTLPH